MKVSRTRVFKSVALLWHLRELGALYSFPLPFGGEPLVVPGVVYGLPGDACLERSSGHSASLYSGLFTNRWLPSTWAPELQPRVGSSVASVWWVFSHITCLEDGFGSQRSCLVPWASAPIRLQQWEISTLIWSQQCQGQPVEGQW